MIADFLYRQPVEIHFGRGKFDALPNLLAGKGIRRALIVCGSHFAPKAEALAAAGQGVCGVYSHIQADPQLSDVKAAAALASEMEADAIIGVGGGSAMDSAKFAAAIVDDYDSADGYFEGKRPFPARRLPVIAVPTTAGTGSEVTQVSVISRRGEKRTINDPAFMPALAMVDPALGETVPPHVVMCTGLDALAHALEGYWSRNHQPISDLMAIEAVRRIWANLERAWRDRGDAEACDEMAFAALLGGLSFALPKTAGCHACSYPLCEHFHISHGEACAFTLDSFVLANADDRLAYLCRAAGVGTVEDLARRIREWKAMAGLRTRLRDLGDTPPRQLAREAAAHPLMGNNPVPMDEDALCALFTALQ